MLRKWEELPSFMQCEKQEKISPLRIPAGKWSLHLLPQTVSLTYH